MSDVIRIGAFFDGTGNNIWNDEKIGDGSQTNVAKLYSLYEDQDYEVLYEEGVGTEKYRGDVPDPLTFDDTEIKAIINGDIQKDEKYDAFPEMAFGTTAKSHVEDMLVKISNVIEQHPDKEIVIDVYGFSRGAAEARDFVNEINKLYAKADGSSVVGFVGLFDTVASIGLAGDEDFSLNLNLNDDSAERIVHLVAEDEVRSNFPIDTFAFSTSDVIYEKKLNGVHSDIGGGYGDLDNEVLIIVEEETKSQSGV
jgi:uncharacterized protein (DUF2235 family)